MAATSEASSYLSSHTLSAPSTPRPLSCAESAPLTPTSTSHKKKGGAALKGPPSAFSSPPRNGRKFKGVRRRKWGKVVCEIRGALGRRIWLGSYATEEEAARVYDEAARLFQGDRAWLNFPEAPAGSIRLPSDVVRTLLEQRRIAEAHREAAPASSPASPRARPPAATRKITKSASSDSDSDCSACISSLFPTPCPSPSPAQGPLAFPPQQHPQPQPQQGEGEWESIMDSLADPCPEVWMDGFGVISPPLSPAHTPTPAPAPAPAPEEPAQTPATTPLAWYTPSTPAQGGEAPFEGDLSMDTFEDLPPLDLDELLALQAPPAGEPTAPAQVCMHEAKPVPTPVPAPMALPAAAPAAAAAPAFGAPAAHSQWTPESVSAADSLASVIIAAGLRALLMGLPRQ